jgi:hypothetical protein
MKCRTRVYVFRGLDKLRTAVESGAEQRIGESFCSFPARATSLFRPAVPTTVKRRESVAYMK